MAKIQSLGSGQKIKQNVNVAYKTELPSTGATIASTIGEVGKMAAQLENKRRVAEDNNFSQTSLEKLKVAYAEIQSTLSKQYQNDPKGYAEAYREWLQATKNELLRSAPSEDAKRMFTQRADYFSQISDIKAQADENKWSSQKYIRDRSELADSASERYFKNPDIASATLDIQNYKKSTDNEIGLTVGAEGAKALNDNYTKKVRTGVLSGIVETNYAGVVNQSLPADKQKKQVDAFIKGDSALFDGWSGPERLRFKNQAYAAIDRQQAQESKHLSQKVRLVSQSFMTGQLNMNNPKDAESVQSLVTQIKGTSTKDDFEKSMLLGQLGQSVVNSELEADIALLPQKEAEAKFAEFQSNTEAWVKDLDPTVATAMKGQARASFQQIYQKSQREFQADPVGFMGRFDKSVGVLEQSMLAGDAESATQYYAKLDAMYDAKGVPSANRKYVSKAMTDKYKNGFNQAIENNDFATASAMYSDIERATNGNSYKLLKDLGVSETYMVVGEASQNNRAELLETLKKKKDGSLNKDFKASYVDGKPLDDKKIRGLLNTDFYQAIQSQNTGSLIGGENTAAYMETAVAHFKAGIIGGLSEDEAVKRAWDAISDGKTVVDGGDTKSRLVIPTSALGGANAGDLEEFISNTTGGSGADLRETLGQFIKNTDKAGNFDNLTDNIADSGYWTFNKGDGRMYLRVVESAQTKDGFPKTSPVKGKDGKAISMLPQEMAEVTSTKMRAKALERQMKVMAQKKMIANRWAARAELAKESGR